MVRPALMTGVLALLAACANGGAADSAPAPAAATPAAATIAYGQRIAERSCGGCHAVGEGASPLADAPPFRTLHRRYPAGGLAQLLEEGMLPPATMQEEGSRPSHPRMPTAALDPDEVAALTAYLRSLEPTK